MLVIAGVVGTVANQLPWASDILLYQNGLRFVPESSNLKDNLANALDARGRSEQAVALYRDVLLHDPGFLRSYCNLARVYLKRGRYGEAEQVLLQAIRIDESDSDQFILLALAQWHQNKLNQAKRAAEFAIGKSPLTPGYHYVLGKILDTSGNRDQALAEFRRELTNHPNDPLPKEEIRRLESK